MPESKLVWVTRSSPFNLRTSRGVIVSGHRPATVPALHIRPTGVVPPAREPTALIFTSAHAVNHHHAETGWRSLPVFAACNEIANLVRERGYRDVRSSNGNASDLRDFILGSVSRFGHAVHFGVREPSATLVAELEAAGLSAEHVAVYETVKATPEQLKSVAAAMSFLGGIIVHCARAGEVAAELVAAAKWHGAVYCLTPACAEPFKSLPGLSIETAPAPTEEALLGLLEISHRLTLRPGHEPPVAERWPALRLVVSNEPERPVLRNRGAGDGPEDPPPSAA
jgi:uroporphyrinogen-III synthase